MSDEAQQAVGYSRFQMKGTVGLAEESIDQEERIVRGYRVIERGEASGHYMWVDETMLDQVVAAGNASKPAIKSRWTHPGLCSDGLGKFLGRAKNFRHHGDKPGIPEGPRRISHAPRRRGSGRVCHINRVYAGLRR